MSHLFVAVVLIASGASVVNGHGLVSDPPSRQAFCGLTTKPDTAPAGSPCLDAFNAPGLDPNQAYNYMSVLTHTQGYLVNGTRQHVCSYNSEFFKGGPTWIDQPINWPTSPMSAGQRTFTWRIEWGPHFSDTKDFIYWITKPDFVYTVGTPLKFSDFEAQPFCNLPYNDANPSGNPNVSKDTGAVAFKTKCNVPSRSGRHVIYAEWGRTASTWERFHGCIDVCFSGNCGNPGGSVSTGNAAPSTTTVIVRTTASPVRTSPTRTTAAATTKTTGAPGACATLYGQCGGQGWTGPTCCTSGTCKSSGQYYSQCLS